MLPLILHSPWWSGLYYKKTKMVDLQLDWLAAWPDTSLFGDESINTTDDFLISVKSNSKEDQAVLDLPDLEWLHEKVDLSVLNIPHSVLDHHNETQPLMEDESAFLSDLLGDSFDASCLTSDLFKNEEIDFSKEFGVQSLISEPASSEILDSNLASPQCSSLQLNSPAYFPVQSPASPYSDISDASEESNAISCSPELSSLTSDISSNDLESSQVQVSVCNDIVTPTSISSEPVLSIEEVSESVRKRKFVNDGLKKPKVVKVMFPDDMPAARVRIRKPNNSRERKKVQNKEAAARYRIKKRMEDKILTDEVEELESTQKDLKEKHDQLQTEIKYLKSLMCEMLTKRGILK